MDFVIIGALTLSLAFTVVSNRVEETASPVGEIGDRIAEDAVNPSIAVLPFTDVNPAGDQGRIGVGIAYEMIDKLNVLDGLRVTSPTYSFSFQESGKDIRTIRAELGVDWILEGSVRKNGDDLLITAVLTNALDGFPAWSERYDRRMTDIFQIQTEIAASVAGALGVTLGVGGPNAFPGAGTQDVEAYEAFLLARPGDHGLERRIELLERAIDLDPNYAGAWAALGVLRGGNRMWDSLPEQAPELIEGGYALLQHAVELDPRSCQANLSFGTLRYAKHEWLQAEEARLTAIRDFALWYPVMADVRRLPGFKTLVSDIGLVRYWRAFGWADDCQELPDDDFACR